jgi:tRNA nucleotidyltransferase (CCA-adding enzyme)
MAVQIGGGEVLDPYDGRDDLDARLIRVLHKDSFRDDPTRIFRAVRYASRYDFELDPSTEVFATAAIQFGALETVSAKRIGAELQLQAGEAGGAAWAMLDRLGAFEALVPGWGGHGRAIAESIDRLDSTASELGEVSERLWQLRLAAAVFSIEEGTIPEFLNEIGLRSRDVNAVMRSVAVVNASISNQSVVAVADNTEIRRLLPSFAHPDDVLLASSIADGAAAGKLREYREAMTKVEFFVTGHDLQSFGLERGPRVGQILEDLYERTLAGELVGREQQNEAARHCVEQVNVGG